MTTLQVLHQRPALRYQRLQRKSFRDNPRHGIVWGQEDWPGVQVALPVLPPELTGLTALTGDYYVAASPTTPDGELTFIHPALLITVLAGDGVTDNTTALTLIATDTVYIATAYSAVTNTMTVDVANAPGDFDIGAEVPVGSLTGGEQVWIWAGAPA
jgi:hypothetical protein